MAGWAEHDGLAVALPLANVDTDQLIPARFMSVPRSAGYGDYLLHDLRFAPDGSPVADFPLNRHAGASVLVSRRNFGSGSSREAAVYALVDYGIRAVLAPSFGDIFSTNAANNGLLAARVGADEIEALVQELGAASARAQIMLADRVIVLAGHRVAFDLDEIACQKLMNGWDDIDLTASHADRIADFGQSRRAQHPWAWPAARVQ